ncbi:protein-methionine-sulfoxide reductase heme-binding subunit MsrQ [Lutimaribacter sp. EGI FJ00015]|uniref:Protein-methionine-sulfoxide reductase heme-binding subunit MsrQ n=1 Tax=Lutimaribacter degradans TaxID=2945989 RepID=A0ACC5ZX12_9RHOB|nr:protein-methionine-sulfoxide reductase heme-binding subunit MsrQ [Lutimaribacter sp. EGI FJ00013]MCM2562723.1 protein-methionine-sulfoxide reductase heme-binding subunit MsrQ [Lutimaribacter sp. EGI FJ00013]MCO0613880.1 protein-methionine-sulfoxide reductase heme-binding subunit MsrQ [Lutimaribacter sp. EGI FJ00015]MCO0636852.1 protein-methionine-sulfoxide reductase heme-binding subunit MsrQ [Lutimaribacter sp. EGI FJ00014]
MGLRDRINAAARRLPTWAAYIGLAAPAPWLFYMGLTGGLGVEPVKALEHEYGALALKLLIAGLCITPLRRHLGVNLLKFRRALGLLAFFYVVLHLTVWAVLDVQSLERVWADIVKRPYITIGMAAFVLMVPLVATSNNRAVRSLGRGWGRLHRLTYVVVPLAGVHFIWLRKGLQPEPLIYMAAILLLLALRVAPRSKKRRIRAA